MAAQTTQSGFHPLASSASRTDASCKLSLVMFHIQRVVMCAGLRFGSDVRVLRDYRLR